MALKDLVYRYMPQLLIRELRHRKHLRDLATDVEPEDTAVRKILRSGQMALDIGANYGVFTKLFSEVVGAHGSVLAFEPVPETFRTLKAGVKRFQLDNVRVINQAVSDHVGSASMTIPPNSDGAGDCLYQARIDTASSSANAFEVRTLTIDSLQLTRVDFIKIDVEGHELEVLRGGRATIDEYHPALLVEVTSRRTVEFICEEMGYASSVTVSPSNQLFIFGEIGFALRSH